MGWKRWLYFGVCLALFLWCVYMAIELFLFTEAHRFCLRADELNEAWAIMFCDEYFQGSMEN